MLWRVTAPIASAFEILLNTRSITNLDFDGKHSHDCEKVDINISMLTSLLEYFDLLSC